jgi:hypothetical protein
MERSDNGTMLMCLTRTMHVPAPREKSDEVVFY